eukprot:m.135689 g.135689  ORF g.135689 m.135689 type:complete len:848 (+) comp20170_c0_seq2:149-2692(+)
MPGKKEGGKVERGLASLLQKAKEQADEISKVDVAYLQGARLQRTGPQVLQEAQELAKKTTRSASDTTNIQAQILHASHGMNLSVFGQQLAGLNLATSLEPIVPLAPTSVEGFLKNERQTALLTAIQKSQKNTMEDFQTQYFDGMQADWAREKESIREVLGAGPLLDQFTSASKLPNTGAGFIPATEGQSGMDITMTQYAAVVCDLVKALLAKAPFRVVERLREATAKDDTRQSSKSMWEIVNGMLGLERDQALGHHHFMKADFSDARTRRERLTPIMVANAKTTLQRRYLEYMDQIAQANGSAGGLVTSAGSVEGIQEFMRCPQISKILQERNGSAQWAGVYYSMRCGRIDTAKAIARMELGDQVVRMLEDYGNGDIANSSRKCSVEYLDCRRTGADPYKRAVMNVIGKCEIEEDIHSEIAVNIEDYLWIKLNLVRVGRVADQTATTDLAALQHLLSVTHGEAYFQADREPFRYLEMLLLTAQFEKAVSFISQHNPTLGVHLGVALWHYGLLNTTDSIAEPLMVETQVARGVFDYKLNFALALQRYTLSFARTHPYYALRYSYLMKDYTAANGQSLFVQSLTDLVIETREWATILGEIDASGHRQPAEIDIFCTTDSEKTQVMLQVAQEAESRGRVLDALRLYDLANHQENVLELLCRNLAQDCYLRSAQSIREDLQQFGHYVYENTRYQQVPLNCKDAGGYRKRLETVAVLLKIMEFFDLYFSEKFQEGLQCLEKMRDLNIVPVNTGHVAACVNNFDSLSQEVRRNLPQLLLCAMICLDRQHKLLRSSSTSSFLVADGARDGGRTSVLHTLRDQAQAIVSYSGQIPFRMPGVTNAELIRLEVGLML